MPSQCHPNPLTISTMIWGLIPHFSHLNVSTLQCQTKASFLILDKMQCHFRIALLLEISNDRLAYQFGIPYHVQYLDIWGVTNRNYLQGKKKALPLSILPVCSLLSYLIIFSVDQGQLELELSGIYGEHPRTTFPVQAVYIVALHPRDIDG